MSFDLNLELGRAVEAVERILARRDEAKRDYWSKLDDDLAAAALLVHKHHDLYREVGRALQGTVRLAARARARRQATSDATTLLEDASLPGHLMGINAHIEAASTDRRRLKARPRAAAKALRDAAAAGERYIKYMECLQDGEPDVDPSGRRRWNLADLRIAFKTGPPDGLSLEEISDKVGRALYVTKLMYAVERSGGLASQKIRMNQPH